MIPLFLYNPLSSLTGSFQMKIWIKYFRNKTSEKLAFFFPERKLKCKELYELPFLSKLSWWFGSSEIMLWCFRQFLPWKPWALPKVAPTPTGFSPPCIISMNSDEHGSCWQCQQHHSSQPYLLPAISFHFFSIPLLFSSCFCLHFEACLIILLWSLVSLTSFYHLLVGCHGNSISWEGWIVRLQADLVCIHRPMEYLLQVEKI